MLDREAAAMPAFDVLVNNVRKDVVERLYADADLRVKLITHNWPTDEETCKKIAEKFDLAEEEVGAVSKHHLALEAQKKSKIVH